MMSQIFKTWVPKLKHQKLLQSAQTEVTKAEKIQDEKTLADAKTLAEEYFRQQRYWWIDGGKMIFDTTTGILWQGKPDQEEYYFDDARKNAVKVQTSALKGWILPEKEQIKVVVENNFPLLLGGGKRILNCTKVQHRLQSIGLAEYNYPNDVGSDYALTLYVNYTLKGKNLSDALTFFIEKNFSLRPFNIVPHQESLKEEVSGYDYEKVQTYENNKKFWSRCPYYIPEKYKTLKKLFLTCQTKELKQFYLHIKALKELPSKKYSSNPNLAIETVWKNIDYISTRLNRIEQLRFNDVEQGMWEFYAPSALQHNYINIDSKSSVRARNPVLDIQNAQVAIDFGTSSTVVALRKNGKCELLRIGVQAKDLEKNEITDQHYENPTVLEFRDIQTFLNDWKSEAYRPLLDWNTIHCSHEARASLRENQADSKIVGSIFARLKQWALRDENQPQVRIRDQKGFEYQLDALQEYNPVNGQLLEINKNYPELDPIELYAWFLGMNINWRERGIFLKYCLTFPVEYPKAVKSKILAAFRRGLQRSLPESLMYEKEMQGFEVKEVASEPAAFAASALQRLDIEPEDDGVSYAVFDFGGGTTDFDYGLYRTPSDAEYDAGFDHVIEHFGSSGDKFLGGENLLENMAFLVFQQNKEQCLKHNVSFTIPLDAESFPGSELLIARTQAAYTNTTIMMSKLRPLWESGKKNTESSGAEILQMVDKSGNQVDCEFTIKQDQLIAFLQNRIAIGLTNFFRALKAAFESQQNILPETVHIFLAGNSSRSNIVQKMLGLSNAEQTNEESETLYDQTLSMLDDIFQEDMPDFEIHPPLDPDVNDPYAPTAKTGVALGLLRVCDGESLKVINHAEKDDADSPFQYYVGDFRRDRFQTALSRGHEYNQWIELGRPRNNVFIMGYTTSAKAADSDVMKRGEYDMFEQSISLAGDLQGYKVFGRVVAPNEIEICCAQHFDEIQRNEHTNLDTVTLVH